MRPAGSIRRTPRQSAPRCSCLHFAKSAIRLYNLKLCVIISIYQPCCTPQLSTDRTPAPSHTSTRTRADEELISFLPFEVDRAFSAAPILFPPSSATRRDLHLSVATTTHVPADNTSPSTPNPSGQEIGYCRSFEGTHEAKRVFKQNNFTSPKSLLFASHSSYPDDTVASERWEGTRCMPATHSV